MEDIKSINHELARYSAELATRPQIIIANKVDALDRELVDIPAFETFVKENGWELLYGSAATGQGIREMVRIVSERLRLLPPLQAQEAPLR